MALAPGGGGGPPGTTVGRPVTGRRGAAKKRVDAGTDIDSVVAAFVAAGLGPVSGEDEEDEAPAESQVYATENLDDADTVIVYLGAGAQDPWEADAAGALDLLGKLRETDADGRVAVLVPIGIDPVGLAAFLAAALNPQDGRERRRRRRRLVVVADGAGAVEAVRDGLSQDQCEEAALATPGTVALTNVCEDHGEVWSWSPVVEESAGQLSANGALVFLTCPADFVDAPDALEGFPSRFFAIDQDHYLDDVIESEIEQATALTEILRAGGVAAVVAQDEARMLLNLTRAKGRRSGDVGSQWYRPLKDALAKSVKWWDKRAHALIADLLAGGVAAFEAREPAKELVNHLRQHLDQGGKVPTWYGRLKAVLEESLGLDGLYPRNGGERARLCHGCPAPRAAVGSWPRRQFPGPGSSPAVPRARDRMSPSLRTARSRTSRSICTAVTGCWSSASMIPA